MANETLLDSVKVGDTVVYSQDYNYSFETVTKRTPTTITVRGRVFYRQKVGNWISSDWTGRLKSYESGTYRIYPNTEHYIGLVAKTQKNLDAKAVAVENQRACEASDKAEMEAFLVTDEGKRFTALVEDWVGTEIRVFPNVHAHVRGAYVYIVRPDNNERVAEIAVRQTTEWKSFGQKYTLGRAEIDGQSRLDNPYQAEKYQEALTEAIKIAKLWDVDEGKIWDENARVALDKPVESGTLISEG